MIQISNVNVKIIFEKVESIKLEVLKSSYELAGLYYFEDVCLLSGSYSTDVSKILETSKSISFKIFFLFF